MSILPGRQVYIIEYLLSCPLVGVSLLVYISLSRPNKYSFLSRLSNSLFLWSVCYYGIKNVYFSISC